MQIFLAASAPLCGKWVCVICPPERNLGEPFSRVRKRRFFSCNSSNKYLTSVVHGSYMGGGAAGRTWRRVEVQVVGCGRPSRRGTGGGASREFGSMHSHSSTSMQHRGEPPGGTPVAERMHLLCK